MKNLDFSIIIVNYNAREYLRNCLTSLNTISKDVSYEVFVVDNASSDDSAEMVRKEFPEVQLTASKENLGFSRGNNVAVKKAKGRYLLFLNPDTEMRKETMETVLSFMDENQDAGASTCYVSLPDGKIDDGAHRGFPTPWNALCYFSGLAKVFPRSKFFNGYNLGWCDMDRTHTIDALVGAFMLVRREAGEAVGWWDEDYFFYGEDLDFCYELKEKGWKIYFIPSVSVFHHKGVTGGIKKHSEKISTANKETKVRATNARFNAMKIFYTKHYLQRYPRLLTWVVLQGVEIKRNRALSKI